MFVSKLLRSRCSLATPVALSPCCTFLTPVLTCGAALVATAIVAAVALLASATNAQDSIEDAKQQREEARAQQLEAEANLDLVEAEDIEVVQALEAITELINQKQAEVDRAEQGLARARETVAEAQGEAADADSDIEWLHEQIRSHALESYLDANQSDLALTLSASDAGAAVRRLALLESVGSGNVDLLDRLRAVKSARDDALVRAEEAEAAAESLAEELSAGLEELQEQRERQQEIKAEVDARRTAWESQIGAFEAEDARLTEFIRAEEARIAEQRRKEAEAAAAAAAAANNPGPAVNGGSANPGAVSATGWTWPTSGGVASGFGLRLHPILGYYRMHSGLDIGGASGQPIWAATSGTVIMAGWNGGYGNTVIISHGNGVTTLYAHMSAIGVSNGQSVSTGQQIGQVGSTGLSTGPHLHFEVRINGNPVDPRPYLP